MVEIKAELNRDFVDIYMWSQYGSKTISSVMAEVNWNHRLADYVKGVTGKYPAMNCYDFIQIYVPQTSMRWQADCLR